MIPVTAFCTTKGCGHAWLASAVSGSGPAVELIGCTSFPCPKCGGTGRIPDGMYSELAVRLRDTRDVVLVREALEFLYAQAKKGANAAQLGDEISRSFPYLAPLKPYLPKDAVGLGQYFLVALGVLNLLHECTSRPQPAVTNIYVQTELQQSITQAAASRDTAKGPRSRKHKPAR
jgi:hypothetical protein